MSNEQPGMFPTHGPTVQATSIVLADIRPEAKRYLQAHGCTIHIYSTNVVVSYPAGTTSREIYPRTGYSRHLITLPDGTQLQEARPGLGLFAHASNCLYLPKEAENA